MKFRFSFLFVLIPLIFLFLKGRNTLSIFYSNLGNYEIYELAQNVNFSTISIDKINKPTSLFSSAYYLYPDSKRVLLGLARLYILQGDLDDAKYMLLRIQDDNNQVVAWLSGEVLFKLGDYDAVLTFWKDAIPTRWILNMAKEAEKKGDYEESLILYKFALEVDPDNPNANYLLGAAYAGQGEFVLAEKYFQKAIELSPTTWWYHLHLAQTYEHWGYYQDAVGQYKITISLVPGKADIKERLYELEARMNP